MKASRESVAYRLDTASSPDYQQPRRSESSMQASAKGQPASLQSKEKAADKAYITAHSKKNKKGARIRQRIRVVTPARLFCAVFVVILCVSLVYSQMMLTVQTHKLSTCEVELKTLQSENVSLMSKYEQQYNADYIAEYAENVLGMVKLGASQIEYIELSGKGGIEVSSSAPATGGVVGSLVRGFTALLEYLR